MPEQNDVLIAVHDGIGHVTLNRPRAINALTHRMVTRISAVPTGWLPAISSPHILVTSN